MKRSSEFFIKTISLSSMPNSLAYSLIDCTEKRE